MDTEPNLAGTTFAGCRITEKIGQGGMGSVYKARQESLDKFVCVKLLSQELARDRRNVEFLMREARSAAKLDHPNIVHVYNFGKENGSYFIVMSYVEGKSLQDMVDERGPLPAEEASAVITGVLEGLAHAHSKNIIHRDIKPSNILVGPDGVPRIVDFGLARSVSEEKQLTVAGEMIGTAYFMSPEQGLAGTVDNRADLYAVGATFFYILTGKYPFEGKSAAEVIHKHIGDPVPNVVMLNPDIPLRIAKVIERLLRKKPEERYQTAAEVIAALRASASGESESHGFSQEKTFDMPEISARFAAHSLAPTQASLERATPQISDRSIRNDGDSTARLWSDEQAAPANAQKPAVRRDAAKIALNLALSLAGAACFLFAGASGSVPRELSSPFTTSPFAALILAATGAGLLVLAIMEKPAFTPARALFAAGAALAAYAGGACIPSPVAGTSLASKAGLVNIFSQPNLIVCSMFFYLSASRLVLKENRGLKAAAAAAYAAGLVLTYFYFAHDAPASPEKAWMAAAGALALLGILAAFTQEVFYFFTSPQLMFLAANLAIFAMFTNPQVEKITAEKAAAGEAAAQKENTDNTANYLRMVDISQAETPYDSEGRAVEKAPPEPPREVQPPKMGKLRGQARIEYYGALARRIGSALTEAPGILLVAFFLALMANACFMEELGSARRGR